MSEKLISTIRSPWLSCDRQSLYANTKLRCIPLLLRVVREGIQVNVFVLHTLVTETPHFRSVCGLVLEILRKGNVGPFRCGESCTYDVSFAMEDEVMRASAYVLSKCKPCLRPVLSRDEILFATVSRPLELSSSGQTHNPTTQRDYDAQ